MWFIKKYIINEAQRGLLFKDQQLIAVLKPGVYRFFDINNHYQLQSHSIGNAVHNPVKGEVCELAELHPQMFAEHLQFWKTTEYEVGLVYEQGVLREIKKPGQKGAWWKSSQDIQVVNLNIRDNFAVTPELVPVLDNTRDPFLSKSLLGACVSLRVPAGYTGFLNVDGDITTELTPGVHMYWTMIRRIDIERFDLRLQNMEINGQEILTRDKVSLRINLTVMWKITDARKVMQELKDAETHLYRELQLALRTVVSTQTLDELLADKNSLNEQVLMLATHKVAEYGINIQSVGARDIILPGEMKAILTQVVEAQKLAEANLIKRQEETQATRSLHNTAKVMEGNPVLLRLKELEILEKITSRINTLNVYGGLDGVMNDMVKLAPK